MIQQILQDKSVKLYIILGGLFSTNAIVAEFIGGKIFSLEKTIGIDPIFILIVSKSTWLIIRKMHVKSYMV